MKKMMMLAGLAALLAAPLAAQDVDPEKVKVEVVPVAASVHLLTGAGGNLGVSVGEDGVFLIDDQYAPLTPKILAAVRGLSAKPVRFVLNTHWHGDHTGGNQNLAGGGAVIVAHDNVRKRMSVEQFLAAWNEKVPPSPQVALPIVTFAERVSFHLNGDEIECTHVAPAHTDGDTIVRFRKAGVLHTGDVFFNGLYPFIDVSSGGSIRGVIAAVDGILASIDDTVKIIPGHGPLASRKDLLAYRAMLAGVADAVGTLVKAGKTLDEVKAARPTQPWDAVWGHGFLQPEVFASIVYEDLARERPSVAPGGQVPDNQRREVPLEAVPEGQKVRVWPRWVFLGCCSALLTLGGVSLALCWESTLDRLGRPPLPGPPARVPSTLTFEASAGDRVLAEARRLLESGDAPAAVRVLGALAPDDPAFPLALRLRAQAEAVARQR